MENFCFHAGVNDSWLRYECLHCCSTLPIPHHIASRLIPLGALRNPQGDLVSNCLRQHTNSKNIICNGNQIQRKDCSSCWHAPKKNALRTWDILSSSLPTSWSETRSLFTLFVVSWFISLWEQCADLTTRSHALLLSVPPKNTLITVANKWRRT